MGKALVFAPEWLFVAVLVLADSQIAPFFKLHFSLNWHDSNFFAVPLLGLALLARKLAAARVSLILEFFALLLAAAAGLTMVIYMAAVSAGPLWDNAFLVWDRKLGFDWLTWFHFVAARPQLAALFRILYYGLSFQVLYFCIFMGVLGNVSRLKEAFWLATAALLLTTIGSWLMPALGPFEIFNLKSYGAFLPEMEKLREGLPIYRSMGQMQGIVEFPSFHTTMALIMTYAFRNTGVIGWLVAAANLLMLPAIPVVGGHYLVDLFAGALVFALAFLAIRTLPGAFGSLWTMSRPAHSLDAQTTALEK